MGGGVWREQSGGPGGGCARAASRLGECALGPLPSEVALAVDLKEEVSWQEEKIEGVVQFPPINNPGGHGYLLVGGSLAALAGPRRAPPVWGLL